MNESTDSVALCLEVLRKALPDVDVLTEMPPERPARRTVMVAQTGGSQSDFIDEPVMTLMCWGQSDPEAKALAMNSHYALSDAAEDHPRLSCATQLSLSRDEWTANGQARYMVEERLTVNL